MKNGLYWCKINNKKDVLLNILTDSLSDVFFYDRSECEDLTADDIEDLILSGELTVGEALEHLHIELEKVFDEYGK